MNVALDKLFDQYEIWEKDRYEIQSIYTTLSQIKKQGLLNDFDILAAKIKKIEADMIYEQSILLDSMEADIEKMFSPK